MSPLHSSSAAILQDKEFSLPLFPCCDEPRSSIGARVQEARQSTIIEIVIALAIIALLTALLIPTLSRRELTLTTVTRSLIEHLRLARAGAAGRGAHFRVTLQPHVYAIEQLQDGDGDGTWEPNT